MTKEQAFLTVTRLKVYLEKVQQSLSNTTGEIHEFWKREEKKTKATIGKLTV